MMIKIPESSKKMFKSSIEWTDNCELIFNNENWRLSGIVIYDYLMFTLNDINVQNRLRKDNPYVG